MDKEDKIDLIAAALAGGRTAAQGAAGTSKGAIAIFRKIRRQLLAEGLEEPAAKEEQEEPPQPRVASKRRAARSPYT